MAPVILAIDTSSKNTGFALARGSELLKSMIAPIDQTRSEKLWSEIGALLNEAGMLVGDVDVFSVCTGPGGFTGLRVGMAAVKGFAAATGKPIVGITSLENAAYSAAGASAVCALVNAYKGEVYSQLFSFDQDGAPVAENDPLVSTFDAAIERVREIREVVFCGDGAETQVNATGKRDRTKWSIKRSAHCLAEDIAALAFVKYSRGELESAESLKACYVRQSEAEIKLSLGLLGSKIKRSLKTK